MANAGGAWDNAKKIVEVELKQKGTPLHDATVVGDTVGDPFKDTSSVALNPVIKFTTLFGLLAVELAVTLTHEQGANLTNGAGPGLLRRLVLLRLPLLLRHANQKRQQRIIVQKNARPGKLRPATENVRARAKSFVDVFDQQPQDKQSIWQVQ